MMHAPQNACEHGITSTACDSVDRQIAHLRSLDSSGGTGLADDGGGAAAGAGAGAVRVSPPPSTTTRDLRITCTATAKMTTTIPTNIPTTESSTPAIKFAAIPSLFLRRVCVRGTSLDVRAPLLLLVDCAESRLLSFVQGRHSVLSGIPSVED
jgi:hypothetical protein